RASFSRLLQGLSLEIGPDLGLSEHTLVILDQLLYLSFFHYLPLLDDLHQIFELRALLLQPGPLEFAICLGLLLAKRWIKHLSLELFTVVEFKIFFRGFLSGAYLLFITLPLFIFLFKNLLKHLIGETFIRI